MIDVQGLGERLRIERERLGLSQGKFADVGLVTRTTAFRYETGAHSPSLEFLQAIEAIGADVTFIIFGTNQEQRDVHLADAIQLVEDLLEKHELKVPTRVRAALVSRVLEARRRALRHQEPFSLNMAALLGLMACPEKP